MITFRRHDHYTLFTRIMQLEREANPGSNLVQIQHSHDPYQTPDIVACDNTDGPLLLFHLDRINQTRHIILHQRCECPVVDCAHAIDSREFEQIYHVFRACYGALGQYLDSLPEEERSRLMMEDLKELEPSERESVLDGLNLHEALDKFINGLTSE